MPAARGLRAVIQMMSGGVFPKNRRNGARITGTVLFSIHTLGAIGVLGHSGLGLAKVLTVISWLIACGAVVFLWQRSSSEYFRASAR